VRAKALPSASRKKIMLKRIQLLIISLNSWFDEQGENAKFSTVAGAVAGGLWLVGSNYTIVWAIGWLYFISLFVMRWLYINKAV